jgi:hypothetical protein
VLNKVKRGIKMNKKMIALIVLVVIVVGTYGAYYTYATTVLVPEDLKVFESELNTTSEPVISESDIEGMENDANLIENASSLKKVMSSSERKSSADELRQEMQPAKSQIQDLKDNFTLNRDIAARYDVILKIDAANNLRAAYNEKYMNTTEQMMDISDKMATDMENGDNKALANDIREFSTLARQLNNETSEAHSYLQKLVNEVGG